jgi:hypothetical protein
MRVPHRCLERPVWIGRERGIALLALLALVGLGAAIALLAMANPLPGELRREEVTRKALAKAKEALIAYATTYGDEHPGEVPGYLPCPDLGAAGIGGEGGAEASCGAANTTIIGRLPWKTLGIEPLRDGYGECLWYAVSGTFKNNPKTELMNWDTLGQIEVYASDGISLIAGSQPEDRAAAVIFAPGVALGQDRQDDDPGTPQRPVCSEDYTVARFLEASGAYSNAVANGTAGAVSRFIAAEKADGFNDRLLFLTPAEIFAGVQKRSDFAPKLAGLAQTAAQCLTQYVAANTFYAPGDRRFPWTAPAGLTAYTADGYYDDAANSLSGRYPFQIDTSKAAPVPNALASTISGAGCAFRTGGADENWWKNWKDQLFYALSAEFKPAAVTPSPVTCGSNCMQVNGSPGKVAVVIFAGRRLSGQTRSNDTAKATLGNYLEGRNLTNHPNTGGNGNYESSVATATFNDVLYCVTLDGFGNPTSSACP